jgi:hypothetical protein
MRRARGGNKKGEIAMKKLLIAAALLTAGLLALPGFVGGSQAAPAQNPYCNMMNSEKNPIAWGEYYGCIKAPARTARVVARKPVRSARAKSPYCAMASSQKNLVAWNAYYHCLDR